MSNLFEQIKEANYLIEAIGRKGSIVMPVFPVGWEKAYGLPLDEKRKNDFKTQNFKYKGFTGKLNYECRNAGTLMANVEVMGESVWFISAHLQFIKLKDNRENIKREVANKYRLQREAHSAQAAYKSHSYSW